MHGKQFGLKQMWRWIRPLFSRNLRYDSRGYHHISLSVRPGLAIKMHVMRSGLGCLIPKMSQRWQWVF